MDLFFKNYFIESCTPGPGQYDPKVNINGEG